MDILYQDDALLVVRKPVGVSSEALEADVSKSVSSDARIVHRIDQPVSGPLLLAIGPGVAATLSNDMREGRIVRTYVGICERGTVEDGIWTDSVLFDRKTNRTSVAGPGSGRKKTTTASLSTELLGKTDRYDVRRFILSTGRHHQIRVQCAARAVPIVGDLKYGARRSRRTGGIYLHGRTLVFPHPDTRGTVQVSCNPESDPLWDAAVALLSGQEPLSF